MSDYKAVPSGLALSRRIVDCLEECCWNREAVYRAPGVNNAAQIVFGAISHKLLD